MIRNHISKGPKHEIHCTSASNQHSCARRGVLRRRPVKSPTTTLPGLVTWRIYPCTACMDVPVPLCGCACAWGGLIQTIGSIGCWDQRATAYRLYYLHMRPTQLRDAGVTQCYFIPVGIPSNENMMPVCLSSGGPQIISDKVNKYTSIRSKYCHLGPEGVSDRYDVVLVPQLHTTSNWLSVGG